MKCPKCEYLGFETGDRCKNCGYDFSLLAATNVAPAGAELELHDTHDETSVQPWTDVLDRALGSPANASTTSPSDHPDEPLPPLRTELPLFTRDGEHDDEPLIRLPAAPRAPLAVRRTPEMPRIRATQKPQPRRAHDPVLEFPDGPQFEDAPADLRHEQPRGPSAPAHRAVASGAGRRVLAALLDHAVLCAVDIGVIYFTLRLTTLAVDEWRLLPPVPIAIFLGLLKLAYFAAFTAVGGQTIGKMAARIRVVDENDRSVNPTRALQRSLAGAVSLLTAGLGFVPALVRPDKRAFHDVLAHTRVVTLPSA